MAPPTEKLRLLVVVEDTFARDVIIAAAEASEMFGIVGWAEDAQEALVQIWSGVHKQTLPDVVMAEADLPGYDGTQLARELRRHAEMQGIFIALVAETSDEAGREAAEKAGADCFGTYSTSVPEMGAVLREVGRRAIAASGLAVW